MSLLPFGDLPAYKPRRFVPNAVDLGDWAQIAPLFDRLEATAPQCASVEALEAWLFDWNELSSALDEEANRRSIAMTCHTDDAEAERAYLDFIEHVEPEVKPRQFALEKLLVAHPRRAELPPRRYAVLLRDVQNRVELFRPEIVALETEDTKLSQQYQKLNGSLTVDFRGEAKTLDQMGKLLEEPDRPLRQEAWEKSAERRLAERATFEEQFDAMVALRQQMAAAAGFANFRDYAFRVLRRFDYAPADCTAFHDAIAGEVVPVLRTIQAQRRAAMGLDRLRPWDLAVDPHARPPLRPFETIAEFTGRTRQIFEQLDPGLAAGFRQMEELRLLDLDNRPGKAPGGYQSALAEARLPFIFMNAVGRAHDVVVLLHEAGHAFHALATRDEDVLAYRQGPPIEFAEVASMSMELIGYEGVEAFYSRDEAHRARRMHLEGIIAGLCWIATVDAFQHWIYTHQGHTREERRSAWLALLDRFAGDVDYTGYEEVRAYLWHRQLHFFVVPFYYIEYGIAQLGALQVWANFRRDRTEALTAYQRALALGGSRTLPELFAAAGCRFGFDAETIRGLVEMVRAELNLAPAAQAS
jgi:oligoendopeptidase F